MKTNIKGLIELYTTSVPAKTLIDWIGTQANTGVLSTEAVLKGMKLTREYDRRHVVIPVFFELERLGFGVYVRGRKTAGRSRFVFLYNSHALVDVASGKRDVNVEPLVTVGPPMAANIVSIWHAHVAIRERVKPTRKVIQKSATQPGRASIIKPITKELLQTRSLEEFLRFFKAEATGKLTLQVPDKPSFEDILKFAELIKALHLGERSIG